MEVEIPFFGVSDDGRGLPSLEAEAAGIDGFPSSLMVVLVFFSLWRSSALATANLLSKASNVRFLESEHAAMETPRTFDTRVSVRFFWWFSKEFIHN